ncbi:MAG: hypothetical protein ACI8XC_004357 [Gammaproteobacteria bacterium]|jgi:hypothetical protein
MTSLDSSEQMNKKKQKKEILNAAIAGLNHNAKIKLKAKPAKKWNQPVIEPRIQNGG